MFVGVSPSGWLCACRRPTVWVASMGPVRQLGPCTADRLARYGKLRQYVCGSARRLAALTGGRPMPTHLCGAGTQSPRGCLHPA